MTKEQEATVLEALDMFRPQLQADGGDMEFVSIDEPHQKCRPETNLTCGAVLEVIKRLQKGQPFLC